MITVAIATPLSEKLYDLIAARHRDVHIVWDPDLLPPMRWAGDFKGDPSFVRTAAQQSQFEKLLSNANVLYGIPDVSSTLLRKMVRQNKELSWVMVLAAGGGATVRAANLDDEELRRVTFTTSAGVHAGPLSEFALFGLLCGLKNLPRLQQDQKDHRWPPRWPMGQLSGATVAVVGMGHLGKEIARKLTVLGAKVIGVNKTVRAVPGVEMFGVDDISNVVSRVDGIVSTLPGTEATRHFFSREVIECFRPGLTFVSLGRGTVVDEKALLESLTKGETGFAALDVFESEPLAPESPLWDLPNVLVSPHTAANSIHEERLIAELFCDNLDRFKRGESLLNVVDTRDFY